MKLITKMFTCTPHTGEKPLLKFSSHKKKSLTHSRDQMHHYKNMFQTECDAHSRNAFDLHYTLVRSHITYTMGGECTHTHTHNLLLTGDMPHDFTLHTGEKPYHVRKQKFIEKF